MTVTTTVRPPALLIDNCLVFYTSTGGITSCPVRLYLKQRRNMINHEITRLSLGDRIRDNLLIQNLLNRKVSMIEAFSMSRIIIG